MSYVIWNQYVLPQAVRNLSEMRTMLNKSVQRAIIVKFEGLDACGKTSLRDAVAKHWSSRCRVLTTAEFGSQLDTPASDIHPQSSVSYILRLLALGKTYEIDDLERELLMAVMSRRCNRIVIRNNLLDYDIILVDRSNLSNLAYGAVINPFSTQLHKVVVGPVDTYDLIIWIDTPVEECIQRMSRRALDPVENRVHDSYNLIRSHYEQLWSNDPRIHRLDGTLALPMLTAQAADLIASYMNR